MNSVSYKAVMGSCERWEQWRECMSLLVDQHLGGIKTKLWGLCAAIFGVGEVQVGRGVAVASKCRRSTT